jgi:hypothetical protein
LLIRHDGTRKHRNDPQLLVGSSTGMIAFEAGTSPTPGRAMGFG